MNIKNHVKETAKLEHTYAQISYIKVAYEKEIVLLNLVRKNY